MKIIKKSLFTPNSLLLTMIILGFCHYYLVFVIWIQVLLGPKDLF